ncbi:MULTISPECIES: glycosyltransferase family 4 protein [Stappiaceae]|jgi:glycosyltransferase involved in cell wall biosynthesis|uniref:GDP-mannose-dependent alpha-mannosyltransferase n=2 Tax=Roseibium TaxID=150830 RepID=A0A0M6Y1K9_9HYPH|nr:MULTISPECIES: glycosyltransferase family 1 protein [Stappiaceae]AMN52712.1 GDP-mannose-dependent alpha-mannosyltransferase [Labrenzia sp. CP4]AQQ05907.1 alpha-mannosyltransferase [Roseibium aggregatum]CTQ43209.1 GDP-mannose-dependent alpha-mannosyltransferase [Roseibium aggregatum]
MSSILIVTDAWHPQINGVVRSLERTAEELEKIGVRVEFLTPQEFTTLPCPTYPEIRLSLTHRGIVRRKIEDYGCEHLHIATEGPLGLLAASVAKKAGRPFTTSYHTRFPEYVSARLPVPLTWSYSWLRRFHNSGCGCMVATRSLEQDLRDRGFTNLMRWSRGVDEQQFKPYEGSVLPADLPRPVFMYVGRVAIEKNIKAFLDLDLPGSKVVVGGGPQLDSLRREYPGVHFTGSKVGEDLARHYSDADVFVFPSLTDTFGNVMLEALACGVPVAAFPVMGPLDVISDTGAGVLSEDLREAAEAALDIPREHCRTIAMNYTWAASARQFLDNCIEAQDIHNARTTQGKAAE